MAEQRKDDSHTFFLEDSMALQRKKLFLIKHFRRQNATAPMQASKLNSERISIKLENLKQSKLDSENKQKQQIYPKLKKSINIFNNDYQKCLNEGFKSCFSQDAKFYQKQKQLADTPAPSYPIYNSQIKILKVNPQPEKQIKQKQQIYKIDTSPDKKKFKVKLKRLSVVQQKSNPQTLQNEASKKYSQKLLITQLKTEQAQDKSRKRYCTQNIHNQNVDLSISRNKTQISNGIPIPKLSIRSPLYYSIKHYEQKKTILDQIWNEKPLEQKYGRRFFEYLMRDRYNDQIKKYDYCIKLGQNSGMGKGFVHDLQSGKYEQYRYRDLSGLQRLRGKSLKIDN